MCVCVNVKVFPKEQLSDAKCNIQLQIVTKACGECYLQSHFTDEYDVFNLCKRPSFFNTLLCGGLYLNVSLSKGQLKDIGHTAVANSLSSCFTANSQVAFFRNCHIYRPTCAVPPPHFSIIGFSVVSAMLNLTAWCGYRIM